MEIKYFFNLKSADFSKMPTVVQPDGFMSETKIFTKPTDEILEIYAACEFRYVPAMKLNLKALLDIVIVFS